MIFVTVGTQDKEFPRLLEAIEQLIKQGYIKEKVIVQAGSTKYKSCYMEIHNMLEPKQFNHYLEQSDLIITHGGVGTILSAMKKSKKIIAVPRLKKYQEHENDHQLQIVMEFEKEGYLLGCIDLKQLQEKIIQIKEMSIKPYHGNNQRMLTLIDSYIQNTKPNQKWEPRLFLAFSIVFLICKSLLFDSSYDTFGLNIANGLAWSISQIGFIFVSFLYIFKSRLTWNQLLLSLLLSLFSYVIDTCFLTQYGLQLRMQILSLMILLSCQYIWNKAWIFRRKK